MRLYSKQTPNAERLKRIREAATGRARTEAALPSRQCQRRLGQTQTAELVDAYLAGAAGKDLAQRFHIHRATVTAVLVRQGVALRPRGLSSRQATEAARLYAEGWSLARLGERFGVDSTTVCRVLRAAGVAMREPGGHAGRR